MTSILTNTAAMAALQTLRSIDDKMETTQGRISSGLRVGTAADNAAYWSIATTMRSDNMALSAVQDALGLGAAKVDTAYSAMESVVEVMKEIKSKLVAATEEGVDKNKIQEEITQLQDQLKSIAESASFSGENWLQADLSGGSVTKDVVGSFVRNSDGTVSVKKVSYELDGSTVLFDTAATNKAGLLDGEATSGANAINLTNVNIVRDVVSTKTADELNALVTAGDATYAPAWDAGDGTLMEQFQDDAGSIYVRYYVDGEIQTDSNGKELWARVVATADADLIAKTDPAMSSADTDFTNGVGYSYRYAEDQVTGNFKVTTLTKDSILSVAGATVSGRVATLGGETYIQAEAGKDVWVKAAARAVGAPDNNLAGVSIGGVIFDIDSTNKTLPAALAGASLGFSVSNLDITDLASVATALTGTESQALDFMVQFVNDKLESVISATSELGSISMRIGMQEEFISALTDSIDAGIGRLVDADMNEESTRLKALQTQQQLAVQSLSIANTNSENILSLFRQ